MAGGVNKVILIGNLGADPEVRFTPGGRRSPTSASRRARPGSTRTGQKQERTEWHRIVVWGKLGELCGEYLTKGRQCFVEGRLQTREWTDKENKKNYTTEVVGAGPPADRPARRLPGLSARDEAYVDACTTLPPGGVGAYAPQSRLMIRLRQVSMRSILRRPMRSILEREFRKGDAMELPDYELRQAVE